MDRIDCGWNQQTLLLQQAWRSYGFYNLSTLNGRWCNRSFNSHIIEMNRIIVCRLSNRANQP